MQKVINKKNKLIISMLFIVFVFCAIASNIYAANVNLSSTNIVMYVGESKNVSITATDVTGRFNISSSNGGVASSNVDRIWVENDSKSITIKGEAAGTSVISIVPYSVSSSYNGGNKTINVTVKQREQQPTTPSTPPTNTNNNTNTKPNTANNNTATNNTTNNNTATNTKNNNANLSVLQVNQEGLTPNFNKNKTNYAITVGENVDSLKVTATPEASTSKVNVTGNTNLKNGDNKVYVTVTAQDGTKKVYTITVTKTADAVKSNSYLQNLIVENATLSPEFSKEVFEYDCGTVGASIENLKILAFGENENVKVEITGNDKLAEGENTITVKVISEDGTTTKEYVIKVKKDSSLVEENEIQEINSFKDTENDNKIVSFFKNLWSKIKENWLLVIMYVFIIVEFVEIVYLYRHQERKVKKGKASNKNEMLKTTEKNMTLDKEFKQSRKTKRKLDDNNKRSGRQKFDNND